MALVRSLGGLNVLERFRGADGQFDYAILAASAVAFLVACAAISGIAVFIRRRR